MNRGTQSGRLKYQPAISSNTLEKLKTELQPPRLSIVISDNGESKGPPALFHQSHFLALSNLTGDQGAKEMLKQVPESVTTIQAPEAGWDIDCPETWEAFKLV